MVAETEPFLLQYRDGHQHAVPEHEKDWGDSCATASEVREADDDDRKRRNP